MFIRLRITGLYGYTQTSTHKKLHYTMFEFDHIFDRKSNILIFFKFTLNIKYSYQVKCSSSITVTIQNQTIIAVTINPY